MFLSAVRDNMDLLLTIRAAFNLHTILVSVLVLLLFVWQLSTRRHRHMPPGPIHWPIVGCLPQLILHAKNPLAYLKRLGQRYNGLFSLKMGSYQAVYISDLPTLKEAFVKQAACFSGRPLNVFLINLLMHYNGTKGNIMFFTRVKVHSYPVTHRH